MGDGTIYLMVQDTDKKKPVADKLAGARALHREKWGREPNVAMLNPLDVEALGETELVVRGAHFVAKNVFYVGHEEGLG